jgi:hypothetical protein
MKHSIPPLQRSNEILSVSVAKFIHSITVLITTEMEKPGCHIHVSDCLADGVVFRDYMPCKWLIDVLFEDAV